MTKLLFDRGPEHEPILWSTRPRPDRERWRSVLTILAICMLLALLMPGIAALTHIDHRWVDILAQFPAPALAATLLLVIASAALRLWPAMITGALVALLLAVAVWPQAFADRGVARPGAPVVTLYSANLFFENPDASRIRASIEDANPDIIVLVETSRQVIERLDGVLAGYPYRIVASEDSLGRTDRTVIASRYPVRREGQIGSAVTYVRAVVDTPLGPLQVIGAHLTRPWPYQIEWEQIRQALAVKSLLVEAKGPTVVAGDFNSVSSARIGRLLRKEAGLRANPGWPGTWPARLPAVAGITIDQVYRTPDLAVVSRRVGQRTGSDHRPVVTKLTLSEVASKG
ncbi:MAG TPA: endonuclease/exonuclease/phosphatase family protein [Brevundimonas sp.]|jgi:endonuclease/exonuclease/phosphatase (EEP) superfamily protein YafD